jgi:predicted TIM-barrel fold metal-dependent hydrolase
MNQNAPAYFYNAHTHIFTLNHVPDKFAKGYFGFFGFTIKLSWLKRVGILRWLIKTIPKIKRSDYDVAERMINLIKHGGGNTGEGRSQEKIFNALQAYYPEGTRFIVLPMDMEYMNAGKVPEPYSTQIEQLAGLKGKTEYSDLIFPFVFADPRRISQQPEYLGNLLDWLSSKIFSGIKMYPALGYWPFNQQLEMVYDYALEHNIPIISHCVRGVVHDRGKKLFANHPIKTEAALPGKKAKEYTSHFTHPINFHALLDSTIITQYWGKKKDYSKLKVCIAHFGGSDEWRKYLMNPWVADNDNSMQEKHASLKIENWCFELETSASNYSWFTVIKDMIEKYENVYADISFMLYDRELWPLLKLLLTTNPDLRERVLFGTDYYVVAQKGTERELSIGIRSYLGEELFYQIARKNVDRFLESK